MSTRLNMYRGADGPIRDMEVRHVIVDRCPWFADPSSNPEVAELLAQGFQIYGHVDGWTP